MKQQPNVPVIVDVVIPDGGLDLISPAGHSKPGAASFSLNYELEFGGGYRRIGGFERIDGRPSPHLAQYTVLQASGGFTGVAVNDVVTGATSGATATVCYVNATQIGVTKISVTQFLAEVINVGGSPVGTVDELEPVIDGFFDNVVAEAAANEYRADIAKPAGDSPIRGVAVLNNVLYCWRDVAGALVAYKTTGSGWSAVPLFSQVAFTGGSDEYDEGSNLTQGANTGVVKRVVLESGSWVAGTAAGRIIVDPTAGSFSAGIAGGGGVCTLSGAATAITMLGGGRVSSAPYNFTGSTNTKRLYCCDGVNTEWEFDGTVAVPINTGMGGVKAQHVFCHKSHLFYAYRSSLQHSGTGFPYIWSPIFGAAELTTGDTVTNLQSVSGSESSAALMVICLDSAWVLYGNSSADWDFRRVSEEAGAQPYAAVEINGVLAFDREGFRSFKPTQSFGNFQYESASAKIDPLVRNSVPKAAVLVKNKGKVRFFFSDGLIVTGTPIKGGFGWMPSDYGITIECAVGGEINGLYRVFMGSFDGWVLEADVGRSFDGELVTASMRMASLNQRSGVSLKQYRHVEMQTQTESAFELAVGAEYSDSDPDVAQATAPTEPIDFIKQYGQGLFWDFNSWDRAYWDVSNANRVRYPIHGQGRSVSLLLQSESSNQLPHTIKSCSVIYTPRRLSR